tara:strand:- start:4 stop:546 length:543 start_codon:yes stop_codon:yes gene_type:complete
MEKPKIICSMCNKLRQNHGRGICSWCYRKNFWKPKKKICPRCNRLIEIHAKGYCAGCYNYTFHLDKTKAGNYRKWYNIDEKTYKLKTKTCIICGFDKVIQLHHLDHDHKNNSDDNLVGLCPNHHKMLHDFQFRDEILKELNRIIDDKKRFRQETLIIIETTPQPNSKTPITLPNMVKNLI